MPRAFLFSVPPLILSFFLEPASVSPGGLCCGHHVLDETADGVPWGPISAAHKLARWGLPWPSCRGLGLEGNPGLLLHAEGTNYFSKIGALWYEKVGRDRIKTRDDFMLKPHVLPKPNCSISHPVEFYELDEFRVSIKNWQSGIVQWFQTKMRGNGFSNNCWIQTPVESKQWCNDSFAPRGWWRRQTIISVCSCLRLHSLKRSHDHCWSWQLTEILEKSLFVGVSFTMSLSLFCG